MRYFDYDEAYADAAGKVFFVALPGRTYNADGLQDETAEFRPCYRLDGTQLTAHLFDASGRLEPTPRTMDLSPCRLLLKPGDCVATIHIPEGGPLEPQAVDESLAAAAGLLKRLFPQVKAMVCQTWFLDPSIQGLLKDGSNMKRFAERFDRISGPLNGTHSLYEHIFKVSHDIPLDELQPRNAFQQSMLDYVRSGHPLYWGYGVLRDNPLRG